jgi:hypothetical protein
VKINEIITEGRDGKKPDLQTRADTGEWQFRDAGGIDRGYNFNRIMMASAMADGVSENAVDMPQSSWVEKYNVARPYSEAEHKMMRSAFKTVSSEKYHTEKDHKSREPDDTNKVSPMKDRGRIQPKNKRKSK